MAMLVSCDNIQLAVSADCVSACGTLAHVTQHCSGGQIPVPFPAAELSRFIAAVQDGAAAVLTDTEADTDGATKGVTSIPDEHLPALVKLADYMDCAALMQRLCARLAALDSATLAQVYLPLEVWACIAQHLTLPTGCALHFARPDISDVLQPRLDKLAKDMTLADACYDGHLDVCRWLADRFGLTAADARRRNNYALLCAAQNGHLAVCQWLVERFHLSAYDMRKDHNCALGFAAQFGHLAVCQWFTQQYSLTAGDARSVNNYALRYAAGNGHLEVCQWLVETFSLTASDARTDHNYALRWAAQDGHLEVCRWLTERFNLTAEDARADNNYALRHAAQDGHLEVCRWLTERFGITQ